MRVALLPKVQAAVQRGWNDGAMMKANADVRVAQAKHREQRMRTADYTRGRALTLTTT